MKKKSVLIVSSIIIGILLIISVNKIKSKVFNTNDSKVASSLEKNTENQKKTEQSSNESKETKVENNEDKEFSNKENVNNKESNEKDKISNENNVQNKKQEEKAKVEEKKNTNNSQNSTAKSEEKLKNDNNITKDRVKEKTKSNTRNTAATNEKQNTNIAKNENKIEKPNLIIKNSITGKVYLSKYIDFNGKTVANVTIEALNRANISWQGTGSSATLYIRSIAGAKERGSGPLSGWCYYVNGVKPSVGCGAKHLNKNDKLEWKYVKDGVNG